MPPKRHPINLDIGSLFKKEKHTLSKIGIKGNNFNTWCFIIVNIILNREILGTI